MDSSALIASGLASVSSVVEDMVAYCSALPEEHKLFAAFCSGCLITILLNFAFARKSKPVPAAPEPAPAPEAAVAPKAAVVSGKSSDTPFVMTSTAELVAKTLRRITRECTLPKEQELELTAMAEVIASGAGTMYSPRFIPTDDSQDSEELRKDGSMIARLSRRRPYIQGRRRSLCDAVDEDIEVWLTKDLRLGLDNFRNEDGDAPSPHRAGDPGSPHTPARIASTQSRLIEHNGEIADVSEGPFVSEEVMAAMEARKEWTFDIFKLGDMCYLSPSPQIFPNPLASLGFVIFGDYGLIKHFKLDEQLLWDVLLKIEAGYSKNAPYHTALHAADVLQTFSVIVTKSGFLEWMTPLEQLACFWSCIIHDYQHPGVNNGFLANTNHPLATLYNNAAVLENHSVASAFKVTNTTHLLFEGLSKADQKALHALCIELVLITDMTAHFAFVGSFKSKLEQGFDVSNQDDRKMLMKISLKCADVSNPAKERGVMRTWTSRVLEEFFAQGDREKQLGLPVSPLCDRATTGVAKSQVSFIDFVVQPLFTCFGEYATYIAEEVVPQLASNRQYWVTKLEEDAV